MRGVWAYERCKVIKTGGRKGDKSSDRYARLAEASAIDSDFER